jgi:hypothetical protein
MCMLEQTAVIDREPENTLNAAINALRVVGIIDLTSSLGHGTTERAKRPNNACPQFNWWRNHRASNFRKNRNPFGFQRESI